jgi:uncharacterized protein YjiS (DUF1127 family)
VEPASVNNARGLGFDHPPTTPQPQAAARVRAFGVRTLARARGVGVRVADVYATWRRCAGDRAKLRNVGRREMCDLGLSCVEVPFEADGPFWRS